MTAKHIYSVDWPDSKRQLFFFFFWVLKIKLSVTVKLWDILVSYFIIRFI